MAAIRDDLTYAFGAGRLTPQRQTIAESARSLGRAFTIDDLAEEARYRDPSIGVATVYRAVSAMEATGWLERVGERAGSVLYAQCGAGDRHHHHLVCTSCGRVEPAECPLHDVAAHAATSGFVITNHEVTLYGLCPACLATGS
ncbi:MAG: transcriptional repressor [Coriobacteriales bacterium]|nr:transcriptional repressor [Coriobacteriales bacterium]